MGFWRDNLAGIDDSVLLKRVEENYTIRIDQPRMDSELKREILEGAGKDVLYGAGGREIPVSQATDVMVGNIFRRAYRMARKNLG